MLDIGSFGGLRISENGEIINYLGSRKAEALLVYLAVEIGQHNRNVLAALFWPESSKTHALTSLRVVLATLRKHLGAYVDISRHTVGIKPGAVVTSDVAALEENLAKGDTERFLGIYRGEFLQGFHVRESLEFEDWRRFKQERIHRLIVSAIHSSIELEMEQGDYSRGQSLVRKLLELDPLDELAYRHSMLILAIDDQRSAALVQYEKCRQILWQELGVEPSKETEELFNRIIRGDRPVGVPSTNPRHNLPVQQTTLIGREIELSEIGNLLADPACRLLTLIGPGGIGKTRLAVQSASNSLSIYADGVYFIPVESISSAEHLIPSIADALNFKVDTYATRLDPKSQILDYLKNRSALLIFDGFEHLISEAGFLAYVLDYATSVTILVTSRQRLGLRGEWTFQVAGLPVPLNGDKLPADESNALSLFVDRARRVKADFRLSGEEREAAISICQQVEGMPLGIELASAWNSMLSCKEIFEVMVKNIDFMATSMRGVPEKHRSLRVVFDQSWQLMTEEQGDIFCMLSIFRGGFDLAAVLNVVGASLSQLSTLMDKSLLQRNASGRFSMHNFLRQYALERLDAATEKRDELQERYCRYYVDFLSNRKDHFLSPRMITVRNEVREEMENIRATLHWVLLHWEQNTARNVLDGFFAFYLVQGWHEGKDAFKNIALLLEESQSTRNISSLSRDPLYLSACVYQAFFLSNLGQTDESEAISRESLEGLRHLGMKRELSVCLHNLGVNAEYRGKYQRSQKYLQQAIELGKECQHIALPSYYLWLGYLYFLLAEYERGMTCLEQSYTLFEKKGSDWGKAFALSKMGLAADGLGMYQQAMEYHREALAIFKKTGDQAGKAYALSRMCMGEYFLGEYAKAVQLGQDGLALFKEIGHRWGMCTSLCRLGFAFIGLGETLKAKELLMGALVQSRESQMAPLSFYALTGLACLWVQEGRKETAQELIQFLQQHPQTPSIYLDAATRWFVGLDSALSQGEGLLAERIRENVSLNFVVDWALNVLEV